MKNETLENRLKEMNEYLDLDIRLSNEGKKYGD